VPPGIGYRCFSRADHVTTTDDLPLLEARRKVIRVLDLALVES
jgi:hypothetical protein